MFERTVGSPNGSCAHLVGAEHPLPVVGQPVGRDDRPPGLRGGEVRVRLPHRRRRSAAPGTAGSAGSASDPRQPMTAGAVWVCVAAISWRSVGIFSLVGDQFLRRGRGTRAASCSYRRRRWRAGWCRRRGRARGRGACRAALAPAGFEEPAVDDDGELLRRDVDRRGAGTETGFRAGNRVGCGDECERGQKREACHRGSPRARGAAVLSRTATEDDRFAAGCQASTRSVTETECQAVSERLLNLAG